MMVLKMTDKLREEYRRTLTKKVIYCLDCGHIHGIHVPTGCNYVHYIEGHGAQVCLCEKWNDKKKDGRLKD
jgi:hypothetical protein